MFQRPQILIQKSKETKTTLGDEVCKSILNQFGENQNHHQRLFIQFLTSMLFVLAAYAFVYTNTKYPINSEKKYTTQYIDTSLSIQPRLSVGNIVWNDTISVRKFDTIKSTTGNILSYGVLHLISMYLFSQFVLTILIIMILHLGYSFRRDQFVVNRIRIKNLGEKGYEEIFDNNFKGNGKNIANYLPNFYSILFLAIFITQVFVYFSIYIYLNGFSKNEIFITNFFNYSLSYGNIKNTLIAPFLVSMIFYIYYFTKYNKKINNANVKNGLSLVKVSNRKTLRQIVFISFLLGIAKYIGYSYTGSTALLVASSIAFVNGIASWTSIYFKLSSNNSNKTSDQTSDYKVNILFRYFLHGILFLLSFLLSIYFVFISKRAVLNIQVIHVPISFLFFFLIALFYSYAKSLNEKANQSNQNSVFIKLLENEMYILFATFSCFLLIAILKVKFFDLIFASLFALTSFSWSLSRFSSALNIYFSRRKIEQET